MSSLGLEADNSYRKKNEWLHCWKQKQVVRYSRWKTELPVLHFISAGSASAVASGLFNPLDCLRVRWQIQRHEAERSIIHFTKQILRQEGLISGLWLPGVGANMAGMALASGIRFTAYESIRNSLIEDQKKGWHMVTAGLICGASAYFLTTPFHLMKTKFQAEAGGTPYATNFVYGLTRLVSETGKLGSIFRGSFPLAFRGSFFTAGQMFGYDGLKTLVKDQGYADGPMLHSIASISASFFASFFSAPADYTMARVMNAKNKGLMECMHIIYAEGGVKAFWKGWGIFFVRLVPVMLTYTTVYEQLRFTFGLGFMN